MKKLLLMVLGVLLALPTFARDFSYTYEGNTLTYTVISEADKTCMTREGNKVSGELIIPEVAMDGTTAYSVTSIGDNAFYGCSGLTSVTIGNSVTSIGYRAFAGCIGLTSVTIGNSVTTIGDEAFSACSSLTSVTIGNSVTSIGSFAFAGCSRLTSVTIPTSVTTIGKYAFEYCSGLKKAEFASIEALCKIDFSNQTSNPLYYANSLFIDGKRVNEVEIPNTVTSIGSYTFCSCIYMTSVTIPNSVTSIGNYAFEYCSGLTSVSIPNSVTEIGYNTFNGCSGLTSVTIGNSVTTICDNAFEGCSGLKKAEFASIEALCKIDFSNQTSNPLYYANSLFIDGKRVNEVEIPNTVTSIGRYAFYYCRGLTSVSIPNSVTSIGGDAFHGCSGLTSVTIGNSVTEIGYSTFAGCSGLTSVTIPNSVTTIHDYAFYWCSRLISVTIPNSVTTIGNYAFEYCSSLTSVYYNTEGPIKASGNIFSDVTYSDATLYVPEAGVEECKYTIPWSKFKSIQAFEFSSVDEIKAELDADAPCDIFNLSGVKVGDNIDALAPGIYIVRQGATTKKIAVK